jgi:hypothetical protein
MVSALDINLGSDTGRVLKLLGKEQEFQIFLEGGR